MTPTLKVLHLEDDPRDAEMVRLALRGLDRLIEIRVVTSRERFREALRSDRGDGPAARCECKDGVDSPAPYDLILADFKLSDDDGLQTLALVRRVCTVVPVIFVSGERGDECALAALRGGATDLVFKDRLEGLPFAVERALREHEVARQRLAAELSLRDRTAQLQAISQALTLVLEHEDWHEASAVLLRHALSTTQATVGMIATRIQDQILRCVFDGAAPGQPDRWVDIPVDDSPVGSILKTGRTISVSFRRDGASPAGLPAPWPPVTAFLGIPFLKGGEVVGVLAVADRPGGFGRRQTLALEVLGGAGAILAHTHRRTLRQEELQAQFLQAQKLEAVGRLAGGIAHDFNNLLSVINGYAELTLDDLPDGHPIRANIELIQRSGNRAAALTRQLLLFSRKSVPRMAPARLDDVVRNLHKMLQRLVGEDIQLELDAPPALSPIVADVGQVEQAITNLVVNARDAMDDGGTITLRLFEITLDDDYARTHLHVTPGRYVGLSVADRGTGMNEATVEKIFEPFFTTKEPGKGTGLGLSTVYSIVKSHQGHIEVESAVGQGTSFNLYFPRSAEAPERIEALHEVRSASGNERVLVVEDDKDLRVMVGRILEQGGYSVLSALTGELAMEIFDRDPAAVDLVLTDVVMPGMRGPDLAERVRGVRPEMRVIFMSGYADTSMVPAAQLEMLEPLIQKPFSSATLLRAVREALDGSLTASCALA